MTTVSCCSLQDLERDEFLEDIAGSRDLCRLSTSLAAVKFTIEKILIEERLCGADTIRR